MTSEKEIKIKIKKPKILSKTSKILETIENGKLEKLEKPEKLFDKKEILTQNVKKTFSENKTPKQEEIEDKNLTKEENHSDNKNNLNYEIDSTLNHIIISFNELKDFYFLEEQQKTYSEELQDYIYSEHDVYSIKELFNDINQSLSRYKNRLYKAKFSGDWDNFLTKNELLRFIKKLSLEINSRLKFNLIEEPEDSIFSIINNEKLNKSKNQNDVKTKGKRSSKNS